MGARVARVLPSESRRVSRVDAWLYLRAGQERHLRQPVRVEPHGVPGERETDRLVGRKRDAVGRQVDDQHLDEGRCEGCYQAANTWMGAKPAGSGRVVFISGEA